MLQCGFDVAGGIFRCIVFLWRSWGLFDTALLYLLPLGSYFNAELWCFFCLRLKGVLCCTVVFGATWEVFSSNVVFGAAGGYSVLYVYSVFN